MSGYIKVSEDEEAADIIEIPVEEDDSVLLSTLAAQFPGACGLKYRHPETKALRGLRLVEERLIAPEDGWNLTFFCSFPKGDGKRKSCDVLESATYKTKRMDVFKKCSDLIVLGIPWKTSEQELREHFAMYGEVIMAQIKKDVKSGQSKGYGFVRFKDFETQKRVLAMQHVIDGRTCHVKIPNSKVGEGGSQFLSGKVFVGRTTEDISEDDMREYFEKFGEVTDVFIPKPFRAFAFVTFLDPEVAQTLCGEDHIIKNVSVNISSATPKGETNRTGGGGGRGGWGGGGGGGNSSGNYGNRGGPWNNRGGGGGGGQGNSGGYGGNNSNWNGGQGWNSGSSNAGISAWGPNNNYNGNMMPVNPCGNPGNSAFDGAFDAKNLNALTVPIMAALSQQLLGNIQQHQQQQQPPNIVPIQPTTAGSQQQNNVAVTDGGNTQGQQQQQQQQQQWNNNNNNNAGQQQQGGGGAGRYSGY